MVKTRLGQRCWRYYGNNDCIKEVYYMLVLLGAKRSFEAQSRKKYFLTCEPNEDSNQLANLRSLIRVFFVSKKKLIYPKCDQLRFWSDCVNAQADLNRRRTYMSEGTFSDVTAHINGILSTLSPLGKIFSKRHFEIVFLFFTENRVWHFMQIVSTGDNLHEMPNSVFWEKLE